MLSNENADALILAKIGEAFLKQHTINGAKTAERYTDTDVKDVQRHVYEILLSKYSNLSMKEILYAFKRGMAGEYGEPVYFSVRAVNHWISEYIEKERKPSMRDYNKAIQQQADSIAQEPTTEEREEVRKEIFKTFADWIDKQGREVSEDIELGIFKPESINMPMHSPYWYEKLIDRGLMPEPSTEKKNVYFEKALSLTKQVKNQKDFAIIKAKGWFVRDQVFEWIINDSKYRELLTNEKSS
jgi:hypothetical protein